MRSKTFALAIAALSMIALKGTTAGAAELPTYELTGFPVTVHQFSVMGSVEIQEAAPVPTLMLDGMPASPHQIAVLSPRRKIVGELAQQPTAIGREITR